MNYIRAQYVVVQLQRTNTIDMLYTEFEQCSLKSINWDVRNSWDLIESTVEIGEALDFEELGSILDNGWLPLIP